MAQDRPGEEKPEGFSKYLKRMKTVLRPRSTSKRHSHAAPETAAAAPSEAYVMLHSSVFIQVY